VNPDDDWLDALAGRPPRAGADAAARREASWLRHAQRLWPAELPALPPATEAALLDRARAEGLFRPRGWLAWCAGCSERWRRWSATPWRSGAAGLVLASVLVAFIAVPLLQRPTEDTTVLRAGPDGLLLLRDAEPQARRDRLADALQAAGLPVQRYERLGRYGIDAELPQPLPVAVAAVLRAERIAVPAGPLRIEVEARVP
jgi:hypothetical protein